MNTTTINERDTRAVATHFRGGPRFGRTTTLVLKSTGGTLGVFMGDCTRRDAYRSWLATKDAR